MPAQTACPVPGVDRALSSYINSRDDTLRIRRSLSRYLTSNLRPVTQATLYQHANHECPQGTSAASANPPGLRHSRAAYLQALRANSQAEARHRELQASLEELRNRHIDENPPLPQSDKDDESTRGYTNLLRQRRKVAELDTIQESLEKLMCAKPSKTHDPRDQVQEAIGEQPDLPAEKLEQISQPQDNQSALFKLKQEVLEARSRMDQANIARQQANKLNPDRHGVQEQLHALEIARNEIVEWMQGELAKMEEDSVFLEDASPIKRPIQELSPTLDLESAEARIRASYDRYTSARVELIKTYSSLADPLLDSGRSESDNTTKSATELSANAKLIRPVTKLLPHLACFARSALNERSLLQQIVFLQGQLAASDQELEDALLRLAGESHLLPAGSKDARAWSRVATEAEHATESAVKESLREIRHEVSSIDAVADLCSLQSKVLASA